MSAERIYDTRNQLGFNLNDPKTGLYPEMLDQAKEDGCECPTCGQFVKIYKQSISGITAKCLIEMWKRHKSKWFHIDEVNRINPKNGGNFAKLRHWGLVLEKEHEKGAERKRTSGWWCVTHTGHRFIQNEIMIPKYKLLYNGKVLGDDGPAVGISATLTEKFDYNMLMEGL